MKMKLLFNNFSCHAEDRRDGVQRREFDLSEDFLRQEVCHAVQGH